MQKTQTTHGCTCSSSILFCKKTTLRRKMYVRLWRSFWRRKAPIPIRKYVFSCAKVSNNDNVTFLGSFRAKKTGVPGRFRFEYRNGPSGLRTIPKVSEIVQGSFQKERNKEVRALICFKLPFNHIVFSFQRIDFLNFKQER